MFWPFSHLESWNGGHIHLMADPSLFEFHYTIVGEAQRGYKLASSFDFHRWRAV